MDSISQYLQSYHLLTIARCLVVAIVLLFACLRGIEFFARHIKLSKLPGPSFRHALRIGLSLLNDTSRRGHSITIVMHEIIQSFPMLRFEGNNGHLSTMFSYFKPVVLVTSAEAIKEVLNHPHTQSKGSLYLPVRLFTGNGLITSSGEKWKMHRRLLTPAFHFRILRSIMSIVIPEADRVVENLEREASSNADRCVDSIAPYIIDGTVNTLAFSSMTFESTDDPKITSLKQGASDIADLLFSCIVDPILAVDCRIGLGARGKKFKRLLRKLECVVEKNMSQRISVLKSKLTEDEGPSECDSSSSSKIREPFMDILIREHLINPDSLSLDEIRDQIKAFLLAGGDTTVWSISYTLLLLGHHQEVQEKLYQEIQTYLSHSDFEQLTPERINKFTYLTAVYNESLRLFSPAPVVARNADQDITIRGNFIPKGAEIILGIQNVHLDARYWPDPHRFKPERFLSDSYETYTFIPFSAGNRNCIGQRYANIQAKTTIIRIVNTYRIQSITQLDEIVTFAGPVAHTNTQIKLKLDTRESVDN